MALSQIQCLDDNNVNPRTHESKPEFFYCEDQRLALETLLRDGRETFFKYLEARGVRGFLSDLELEALTAAMEPYDPGKDLFPENVEGEPTPLSQHYWPDLSDTSIPEMELGWPDSEGYRGVTRTTVYTQPPLDGQAHVKEVVRKMITQAQRVIGVVMDIFTDVDIFRDLIDIGFKKRVSVYILLERTNLPHFLSMCRRANMHSGHLKHLRVRCTEGAEFHTRSCTKVRGRMGHRFMFVDGDKAVSGSYSFTWMSSRLDRNLITVTTGQAVEGFDRLFRYLYANSSSVDLRQVVMEPEPEPEVLPQPVTVVLPSATVARKMYNPKYALVAASNPSPTTSVSHESPKEPETPENPKKKRRMKACEEDALPIHPGLVNLEKAYLIPYLPTWPEPDPPSDVIGFINIRDANKPAQVHLQRSEMFETSQAIRFSSPFSKPTEALPEVSKPRQLTVTAEEMIKPQPALNESITAALEVNKTKAKEFTADKVLPAHVSENYMKSKEKAPEQILPASVPKSQDLGKDTIKTLNTDNKLYVTNTATNRVSGSETPYMSLRSGSKTPIPSKGTSSHIAETLSRNSLKSNSLRRSDATKEADTVSSLNTGGVAVYRPHTLESNSTHTSQLPASSSSSSKTKVETAQNTVASLTDSHTQAARMKPESVSISSAAENSPSISQNNPTSMTTMHSNTTAGASVFNNRASVPLSSQFSATQNPSRSSSTSSSLTSPLPVPKPRTVQVLVSEDSSDSQVRLVKKPETTSEPQVLHNEPPVQTAVPSSPVKGPDSKAGTQTHSEHSTTTKETAHPKESLTSKETKSKEADGRLDGKVRSPSFTGNKLQTQTNTLITDSSNAASANFHQTVSNKVNARTLISTDNKITLKRDSLSAGQENTNIPEKNLSIHEFDQMTDVKEKNGTKSKTYLVRQNDPQKISYNRLTPQDIGVFDRAASSKDLILSAVSPSQSPNHSKDSAGRSPLKFSADTLIEQGKQTVFTPAHSQETSPQDTQSNFKELISKAQGNVQTPDKTQRLQLTDTSSPGLNAQSPDRESRPILSPARTPTPDRLSPHVATPDSAPTPDLRSHTPGFRTPTSDVSDGYVSSRDDSNLSTTSEEYYECSDSPFHEPVFEHMFSSSSSTNQNHSSVSAALGTTGRSSVWSERQTFAEPDRASASSVIDMRVKRRQTVDEDNERGKEEKVRKASVVRKTERESQETDVRHGGEADRMADQLSKDRNSTETAETAKDAHSPKKRGAFNQSATGRRVAPGESTTEGAGRTRLSTGDLKPVRVPSEAERPAKVPTGREKVSNQEGLRSSAVERREKPQSSRETEEQKRAQQHDVASPSSRPPRPPRPLSGNHLVARPWVNRPLNQTESKVLEVLEFRKGPTRPPPPAAAAVPAGQKQVSQNLQQGGASRPPPAAQGRTRAGPTQSQASHQKPQSFLHTQANLQSQPPPHSQSQAASAADAHGQDEGKGSAFSFSLSKLYSLKGMRTNKAAAQAKGGGSRSPAEPRKSTS